MTKLKTNKTFIKISWKKIEIKIKKTKIKTPKIKRTDMYF
jgi:hypothetical protein